MTTIQEAYSQGHAEILSRFAAPPETLQNRKARPGKVSPALAQHINRFQKDLGTEKSPLTGSEAFIVTGQQPGYFTGPLYTIYKAITAIQGAQHVSTAETPCIPLFWTAGDDHDFEEIQTAHFLNKKKEILSLSCPDIRSTPDLAMHAAPLSQETHALIDQAAQQCQGSMAGEEVLHFLHSSLDQSSTIADWFSRLMARLFQNTNLYLFDPGLETARQLAAPVLYREIDAPLESTRLLIQSGEALAALGFAVPIHRDEQVVNFFIEEGGRRKRVRFIDGNFLVAGNRRPFSLRAMHQLLTDAPEKFSPNVALRPLVQQQLFQPEAYIAGPGEIAYWAQLAPLFAAFELPMPIVYPRIQGRIITAKTKERLEAWSLDVAELSRGRRAHALRHVLTRMGVTDTQQRFEEERPALEKTLRTFADTLRGDTPTQHVEKALRAFITHTKHRLDKLETALHYADQEKRNLAETQLMELANFFLPLDAPQERVLTIFTFLLKEGWYFMERLMDELDWTRSDVQEILW